MTKHEITKEYEEFDTAKNKVYVLRCACGWWDKSYNHTTLVGCYQHHVITERRKGN